MFPEDAGPLPGRPDDAFTELSSGGADAILRQSAAVLADGRVPFVEVSTDEEPTVRRLVESGFRDAVQVIHMPAARQGRS